MRWTYLPFPPAFAIKIKSMDQKGEVREIQHEHILRERKISYAHIHSQHVQLFGFAIRAVVLATHLYVRLRRPLHGSIASVRQKEKKEKR